MPDVVTSCTIAPVERGYLSNRTLIVLLTLAVSIYLLEKLGSIATALGNVILLLALAWLLAFTLRPAVEWLNRGIVPRPIVEWVERRYGQPAARRLAQIRLPYGLAVAIVYLLLLAVLIYGVLALIPVVVDQVVQLTLSISQLTSDLPGSFQRIIEWLDNFRETLIRDFRIDPAQISLLSPDQLIAQVSTLVTGIGQFVLDLVTGVITFLSQVLLVLLISSYMMVEGHSLTQQLMQLLPDRFQSDARLWLAAVDRTFGGFIRGTLFQAFIYGMAVTALMVGFNLQFAVVVGVATGVLMLIPVIGGLIGLALPLLAGLLQSSPNTLLLVLLLFGFQLFLFNLIMPRILSQSLRMPTLLVFVALIVGGQLLGVWGWLFAVPIVGALYTIGLVLIRRAKARAEQQAIEQAERASG